MTAADVEGRSELARYLSRAPLPGDKTMLLAVAEASQAPDWIRERIIRLPADRSFRTVSEVWLAGGGPADRARDGSTP